MTGRLVRTIAGCLVAGAAVSLGADGARTGFVLDGPAGRLAVGRIAFAPALAQEGTVVLDALRWSADGFTVVAPRVEVAGAALPRAELAALFDPASPAPWAERLARLSAQGLRVPELRVEIETTAGRQVTVYRDLVAGPVAQGRVTRLQVAGATFTAKGPAGESRGGNGAIVAEDLDLAAIARVYAERAQGTPPLARLYGRFSLSDLVSTDPRGVVMKVAAIEGREVSARPLSMGWGDAAKVLGGLDPARMTPESRAAALGTAAEILGSFAIGSLAATGIEVAGANGQRGGTGTVARVAYDGATNTTRLETLAFAGEGARGRLDVLSLGGVSLAPTIAALAEAARRPGAPDPAAFRHFAPALGALRLEGLALDLPDTPEPSRPGAPARPTPAAPLWKVALRSLDLTSGTPVEGIPTRGRLALDGLGIDLPAQAELAQPVAALGYRSLDLSGVVDSRWDPGTGELTLDEMALSGREMGSLRLTGTVAGITRDVFDPDTAVSSVALLGATARALTVDVVNGGLFERIVAQQAKAQSLTSEALRREYGTAAAVGIPAILGNAPAAKALGQAVARFVAKPGRLSISATAKDPAGFGVADVSSAGSPAAMLERLEIKATAE